VYNVAACSRSTLAETEIETEREKEED